MLERRRRALWKDTHHSLRSSLIERPEDTDCSGDEVMDEGYASTDPRTLPIRSPYPRMLSQLLPKPPALPTKITFPRAKSRSASNNQLEHDEQDNQETHDWDNESAIQSYPLGSYGVMGEKPQSRQSYIFQYTNFLHQVSEMPELLHGLAAIADAFDVFILDQYGVLHNGTEPYPGAVDCFQRLLDAGKKVIILSNTSRRAVGIPPKLAGLGFPTHFHGAVTGGEEAWRYLDARRHALNKCAVMTYDLVGNYVQRASNPESVFHGLDLEVVPIDEADFLLVEGTKMICYSSDPSEAIATAFVSTGDIDGEIQRFLRQGLARNLVLLCTNPDHISVLKDNVVHHMGGRIAHEYAQMGGKVVYFGKPLKEHFETSMSMAGASNKARVVHVGDSMEHDVRGANATGIASVFIANGIHRDELTTADGDAALLARAQQLAGNLTLSYIAKRVDGVAALAHAYDVFLLDLYGVLHDGVNACPGAIECFQRLLGLGKKVIMLSNTPRRAAGIVKRLTDLGYPDDFHGSVTGGEEAWRYLDARRDSLRKCALMTYDVARSHAGDVGSVFHDLDLEVVPVDQADFLLVEGTNIISFDGEPANAIHTAFFDTGVMDEAVDAFLQDGLKRRIPLLCTNPDRVGKVADATVHMGGKLAHLYEELGGTAVYFGKPLKEHFDTCVAMAGAQQKKTRVIHVGDSLEHDICGANRAGVDSIFITSGIHRDELEAEPDLSAGIERLCREAQASPTFVLETFRW
ncbi:TPA: hypothetical protein N0F65_010193 [Lagenidium giganteum]|uniref:TIGR01459 family HAD hydrolase n=1 Tax=Lagenidium giganteum TaxID=4803 RepID=A0AAV2Z352_9STRA|nr:TPA: hypothetical protein N0F65_010193 [Lagenidium giganteum]